MKYPNLRYGNPNEFAYYCQGIPPKIIAKQLRRSERSIRNWLSGRQKMPWWIPELMRLQRMEYELRMHHMNMEPVRAKLGTVSAQIIAFPARSATIAPVQQEPTHEENFDSAPHSLDWLCR